MSAPRPLSPCFLILAHADPIQFKRLLARLAPYADVYVHIDAKANIEEFRPDPCPHNVYFIAPRRKINWGGYSIVRAEFQLVEAALNSGHEYSHLVLISGACYPIKPVPEILSHFANRPEHSFIRYADMRSGVGNHMAAFIHPNFCDIVPVRESALIPRRLSEKLGRLIFAMGGRLMWPDSLLPAFGSQWWALTPECARGTLKEARERFFYRWRFRWVWAPDEIAFHSIIANSQYAAQTDGLHDFTGSDVTDHQMVSQLANFHLLDLMLWKTFTIEDWEEIASSERLFVRKISTEMSEALVDRIDQEIHGVRPLNESATGEKTTG